MRVCVLTLGVASFGNIGIILKQHAPEATPFPNPLAN